MCLFCCSLMSGLNWSRELGCVASLDMVLTIKGYRCWDPISKRFRISRHVVFWEHKMFSLLCGFQLSRTESSYFTDLGIPLFPDVVDNPLEVPHSHLLLWKKVLPLQMHLFQILSLTLSVLHQNWEIQVVTTILQQHPLRHQLFVVPLESVTNQHTCNIIIAIPLLPLFMSLEHLKRLKIIMPGRKPCKRNLKHYRRLTLGILWIFHLTKQP